MKIKRSTIVMERLLQTVILLSLITATLFQTSCESSSSITDQPNSTNLQATFKTVSLNSLDHALLPIGTIVSEEEKGDLPRKVNVNIERNSMELRSIMNRNFPAANQSYLDLFEDTNVTENKDGFWVVRDYDDTRKGKAFLCTMGHDGKNDQDVFIYVRLIEEGNTLFLENRDQNYTQIYFCKDTQSKLTLDDSHPLIPACLSVSGNKLIGAAQTTLSER